MENAQTQPEVDKYREIESYIDDFAHYAADCLYVRDHITKKILPLIFNKPQVIFHKIVEKQRSLMGYVRCLLDKARRFGGSTYIEGRGYWMSSLNFNVNAFIVGHEEDSVDTLFSMARLFHERNPLKPQTRYSSKKELLFDNKEGTGLKSEYSLACAKTTSAGRSQGIHFLHGSEVAYWENNPDELLDGLMSCISDPKGTEVYLESTGNGFGNRFQRDVFEAFCEGKFPFYEEDGIVYAWKNPRADWVLVFIPWFAHEAYTRPFDTDKQRADFLALIKQPTFNKEVMIWDESEDLRLQKNYKLTLEQLHWRRWQIENIFKGRIEKFRQEFPSTLEESFLSTGSNVYPKELCDTVEAACREPLIIGELVDRLGKVKVRPNPHGHFRLYHRPEESATYFITVDSAGGMKDSQKNTGNEPDPSCIDVWDHVSGVQMAQWHGHIDYDMIGDLVEMVGRFFSQGTGHEGGKMPVACVELNNHGYTVVKDLKSLGYPLYEAKPGEPGYITSKKSKPEMVDALYELARDGIIQIRCKETVSEMRTFVEMDNKYNAEEGCHDERVDTAAMASIMMRMLPRKIKSVRKRQEEQSMQNWLRRNQPEEKKGYQEIYVR